MAELARYGPLAVAVVLLLGGISKSADEGLSAALFAAGFIVLGAWLAVEVHAHLKKNRRTVKHSKELPVEPDGEV